MIIINKILCIEVVGLTIISLGLIVPLFLTVPKLPKDFNNSLVIISFLWLVITNFTFAFVLLKPQRKRKDIIFEQLKKESDVIK